MIPPPFGNFPKIHPFWYRQASLNWRVIYCTNLDQCKHPTPPPCLPHLHWWIFLGKQLMWFFGEDPMWSPDTFAAPCDRPITTRLQSVQSDDTPSWWHRWSCQWWWGRCSDSCKPPKPVLWVRSSYQVHWMVQTESNCNGLQCVWQCLAQMHCTCSKCFQQSVQVWSSKRVIHRERKTPSEIDLAPRKSQSWL